MSYWRKNRCAPNHKSQSRAFFRLPEARARTHTHTRTHPHPHTHTAYTVCCERRWDSITLCNLSKNTTSCPRWGFCMQMAKPCLRSNLRFTQWATGPTDSWGPSASTKAPTSHVCDNAIRTWRCDKYTWRHDKLIPVPDMARFCHVFRMTHWIRWALLEGQQTEEPLVMIAIDYFGLLWTVELLNVPRGQLLYSCRWHRGYDLCQVRLMTMCLTFDAERRMSCWMTCNGAEQNSVELIYKHLQIDSPSV